MSLIPHAVFFSNKLNFYPGFATTEGSSAATKSDRAAKSATAEKSSGTKGSGSTEEGFGTTETTSTSYRVNLSHDCHTNNQIYGDFCTGIGEWCIRALLLETWIVFHERFSMHMSHFRFHMVTSKSYPSTHGGRIPPPNSSKFSSNSFCIPHKFVPLFSMQPLTGGVKSSSTGLGAATKPVTFSLLQSKQGEKNSF